MSAKVAGRDAKYDRPATVPVAPISRQRKKSAFNAKAAKSKWDRLERSLTTVVTKKQTLSHMEKDMERWIHQRETLGKKMEKLVRKKEKAEAIDPGSDEVKVLQDQMESLQHNVVYVQENINECQSSIMEIEEAKVRLHPSTPPSQSTPPSDSAPRYAPLPP